ncbi:MAG: PPE family protein [Mycobacterium sp.]
MNFATLPPEINSGRMCAGPGSESMTEAAAAWDKLAARLYARLVDYRSVTSKLAATEVTEMTQAAAPYIDWLDATAARAAHAATQAETAASAFESALAAVVPLPVVEANRAQWISLASTNSLGQLSPAIADTEAEYDRMWARDAAAMNTYAAASAYAALLTPFFSPPAITVTSASQVISAGHQVMSAIPEALQAFSSSPLTTVDASLSAVTSPLSKLSSLTAPVDFALMHLSSLNKAAALQTAATLRALLTKPSVTARIGRGASIGTSIGTLSVPQAWTKAAPARTADLQPGWVCEQIHLVHASEPPS